MSTLTQRAHFAFFVLLTAPVELLWPVLPWLLLPRRQYIAHRAAVRGRRQILPRWRLPTCARLSGILLYRYDCFVSHNDVYSIVSSLLCCSYRRELQLSHRTGAGASWPLRLQRCVVCMSGGLLRGGVRSADARLLRAVCRAWLLLPR